MGAGKCRLAVIGDDFWTDAQDRIIDYVECTISEWPEDDLDGLENELSNMLAVSYLYDWFETAGSLGKNPDGSTLNEVFCAIVDSVELSNGRIVEIDVNAIVRKAASTAKTFVGALRSSVIYSVGNNIYNNVII